MNLTASTNNTVPNSYPEDEPYLAKVFKASASVVITLLSIVANSFVIFVVRKMPQMHTNTYYLILNLSVSDLLFTLVAMPPFIMATLGRHFLLEGFVGTIFCKTLNLAVFALIAASVLTMGAIAWDRFFAIVFPLKRVIRGNVFRSLLAAIWVSSILMSSPFLFIMHLGKLEDGTLYCYEEWAPLPETSSENYTIALFILIFLIPFASMAGLYSVICYHLWFRKIPGTASSSNQRRATIYSKKVIKMLITVLTVFIMCWLPLQVVTILMYFQGVVLSFDLYFICEFLFRVNSVINPLLYAIFNEKFRIGFKVATLTLWRWREGNMSFRRQMFMLSRTSNHGNSSSLRAQRKETQL